MPFIEELAKKHTVVPQEKACDATWAIDLYLLWCNATNSPVNQIYLDKTRNPQHVMDVISMMSRKATIEQLNRFTWLSQERDAEIIRTQPCDPSVILYR